MLSSLSLGIVLSAKRTYSRSRKRLLERSSLSTVVRRDKSLGKALILLQLRSTSLRLGKWKSSNIKSLTVSIYKRLKLSLSVSGLSLSIS